MKLLKASNGVKKHQKASATLALLAAAVSSPLTYAVDVSQYGNTVIDFSTQYGSTVNGYSSLDALGAPNVLAYGDNRNAWTPKTANGTLEYNGLAYATPVHAYEATIRETWGAGSVYKVELRDTGGVWHTIWQGTDPYKPGAIANFNIKWPITTYKVNGVRVHTNTDKTTEWEEIDAVQLLGVTTNTTPAVSLIADDTVGSETLSSTGLFVISRVLAPNTAPLTVQYNITGTALNGTDYNPAAPLTGSVTIPAGANKVGIFIRPVDDTLKEIKETVTLTLQNSANYQVMSKYSAGTVTINSND
jgi:hypothetical protein